MTWLAMKSLAMLRMVLPTAHKKVYFSKALLQQFQKIKSVIAGLTRNDGFDYWSKYTLGVFIKKSAKLADFFVHSFALY